MELKLLSSVSTSLLVVVILAMAMAGKVYADEEEECQLPTSLSQEIARYSTVVRRIIKSATRGAHRGQTYSELAQFVDRFGNRISGSENLENAIDYMLNRSAIFGLENVHGEPVTVPRWIRGSESCEMISPRAGKMALLGLGGSVATPPEGITAEALVVESFEELTKNADQAEGKIVVFAEKFENYGVTVKYRQKAASEGAKVGALATLVRSITDFSISSPHTGWQDYQPGVRQIPTACITVEDAMMLLRMYRRDFSISSPHTGWQDYQPGVRQIPTACITVEDAMMLLRMYRRGDKIVLKLKMEARTDGTVESRNTVSEILGQAEPNKAVILSGHLDSWDVGSGAMDDGGGAFISWYSLVLLKQLHLRPRRTIRSILWTGEEEGLIGAYEYARKHDNKTFTLLMESDEGTFNPKGLEFSGNNQSLCILKEIAKLLISINATEVKSSKDVGSDIMVWYGSGVPLASLANQNRKYFWFHHSEGDRMTVEDSDVLDRCLAVWASVAYVVADLSIDLPR